MNNKQEVDLKTILSKAQPFIKEMLLECGSMAKDFRKNGIDFELKTDGTKVTKADLEIQRFILDKLTSNYPGFRITAEEILDGKYASINHENQDSEYRWVIDPIDGTSMFANPNETYYGHAIALIKKNEVVLASFYSPEYEIERFKTNKWSGVLFEASELNKGVMVNESLSFISKDKTDFNERRIILDKVNSEKLNVKDFKAEFKSRSATLSLSLLASGDEDSVVVFSNGDAAIWDVLPGTYFVEKAGGVCVDINFENIYPLKEGKEAIKPKGKIMRPVISGEYFAGYPNAIKKLLNK